MSLPPPPPPGGHHAPPPPPTGPYPPGYPYNVPFAGPGGVQQGASTKRRVRRPVAIAALVAAVVAVVGSVLPWATVDFGFGSTSNSGLDVDGKITIVLALAIGGMLVVSLVNGAAWPAITGIPVFALITLVGAIDIADVNNQADTFEFDGLDVQVGAGLWIVLVAGIAGTIASIVALTSRSRPGV